MIIPPDIITRLQQVYQLISQDVPEVEIDSLDVVKQVEKYRKFWKPRETKIILLAESHVYTDDEDFQIEIERSFRQRLPVGYPSRFVRFVYCVGYGENEILTKKPNRTNSGTPQYWKILCSCVAETKDNLDFDQILKTRTRHPSNRIRNKLNVLNQMKNRGIWLLDASIVGLYGNSVKRSSGAYRNILKICWDTYLKTVIEEANPQFVIVIGKMVEKILHSRLVQLDIPFETLSQPQDHLSKEGLLRNHQRFNEICIRVIDDQNVPRLKPIPKVIPKPISSKSNHNNQLEIELSKLGYIKNTKSEWHKNERIVHVLSSKKYFPKIRIRWKEDWKDDYAIIYDYSEAKGPTCVVPVPELFKTEFVRKKRQQPSYTKSGYQWSQPFPLDNALAQFVIGYKDRWDFL